MAVTNKKPFKITLDSKEVELCVIRPNVKQRQEGQKVYNKAFRDAVESGAILRGKVNNVMREQNLWDDNKEAEYRKLLEKINGGERKIKSGGIKLNQAKELALEMRKDRSDLRGLTSERSSLDNNTAEGQADNAQFNYWVSSCTVYLDTGKTYFNNYEDYLNRDDDPATSPAAGGLAMLLYNLDPDYEKKLPENQFLAKYNFVNTDLHLVDKQGRRVDSEGRLVNKDGRYINEAGQMVDISGNLVNEEGDYIVDFSPFLDEDGKPIQEKVEEVIKVEEAVKVEPQLEVKVEAEPVVAESI